MATEIPLQHYVYTDTGFCPLNETAYESQERKVWSNPVNLGHAFQKMHSGANYRTFTAFKGYEAQRRDLCLFDYRGTPDVILVLSNEVRVYYASVMLAAHELRTDFYDEVGGYKRSDYLSYDPGCIPVALSLMGEKADKVCNHQDHINLFCDAPQPGSWCSFIFKEYQVIVPPSYPWRELCNLPLLLFSRDDLRPDDLAPGAAALDIQITGGRISSAKITPTIRPLYEHERALFQQFVREEEPAAAAPVGGPPPADRHVECYERLKAAFRNIICRATEKGAEEALPLLEKHLEELESNPTDASARSLADDIIEYAGLISDAESASQKKKDPISKEFGSELYRFVGKCPDPRNPRQKMTAADKTLDSRTRVYLETLGYVTEKVATASSKALRLFGRDVGPLYDSKRSIPEVLHYVNRALTQVNSDITSMKQAVNTTARSLEASRAAVATEKLKTAQFEADLSALKVANVALQEKYNTLRAEHTVLDQQLARMKTLADSPGQCFAQVIRIAEKDESQLQRYKPLRPVLAAATLVFSGKMGPGDSDDIYSAGLRRLPTYKSRLAALRMVGLEGLCEPSFERKAPRDEEAPMPPGIMDLAGEVAQHSQAEQTDEKILGNTPSAAARAQASVGCPFVVDQQGGTPSFSGQVTDDNRVSHCPGNREPMISSGIPGGSWT